MPIVTLLTDFGLIDTYAGQVKGAILSVVPDAHLVDITHAVPPQDVEAGAFLLWTAVEAFPAGTIHLAVVDPGVGSDRRAIAVCTRRGDTLVGPDNGLLTWAANRLGGIDRAVELDNPSYWRRQSSRTFHGRDIFGPVAGHLAGGIAIDQLGRAIDDVVGPLWPEPKRDGETLVGAILHVDTFGTLVSNLPREALPPRFRVLIGEAAIEDAPQPYFQAVRGGKLLALVGSAGLLEVAVRDGSAARRLRVGRGAEVRIVRT